MTVSEGSANYQNSPFVGLAKAGHSTLDSSFYNVKWHRISFFLYLTPDPT